VFFYTANLSEELEAQAELTGIMGEIGTVSIYLSKSEEENNECFLVRELRQKIKNGNSIYTWLKDKRFKISSLNQFVLEGFEKQVEFSEGVQKSMPKDVCESA